MNIGLSQAQIKRLVPVIVKEVMNSNRGEVPVADISAETDASIPLYSGQVSGDVLDTKQAIEPTMTIWTFSIASRP